MIERAMSLSVLLSITLIHQKQKMLFDAFAVIAFRADSPILLLGFLDLTHVLCVIICQTES